LRGYLGIIEKFRNQRIPHQDIEEVCPGNDADYFFILHNRKYSQLVPDNQLLYLF